MGKLQNKTRNLSIDIFRYFCAVLVVAVHTNPFTDVNDVLGYIFTQITPRVAVPFFFAASGYFYTQKLENNEDVFMPYLKRILVTYGVWSCIYFVVSFVQWGHTSIKDYVLNCIYGFFVNGSFYHFWFFPALIFSVCITTFLFKIKCSQLIIPLSIVLYIVGCLGCSYYNIGVDVPILGNLFTYEYFLIIRRILLMGFPFFVSGYVILKIKEKFSRLSERKLFCYLSLAIVIWLLEIVLVIKLKLQTNIIITLGLYLLVVAVFLFLLKDPFAKLYKVSDLSRVTANFTYYSHPLIIICCGFVADTFYNKNISETPLFLLTVVIAGLIGFVIYKLNNRFLNFLIK